MHDYKWKISIVYIFSCFDLLLNFSKTLWGWTVKFSGRPKLYLLINKQKRHTIYKKFWKLLNLHDMKSQKILKNFTNSMIYCTNLKLVYSYWFMCKVQKINSSIWLSDVDTVLMRTDAVAAVEADTLQIATVTLAINCCSKRWHSNLHSSFSHLLNVWSPPFLL